MLRAVADELGAFGVVAHGIEMRPSGVRVKANISAHADQAPGRDQVVDLDRGPKLMPAIGLPTTRLVETPPSPPKNSGNISDIDAHHLADAQRDHRERGAGLACVVT